MEFNHIELDLLASNELTSTRGQIPRASIPKSGLFLGLSRYCCYHHRVFDRVFDFDG